MPQVGGDRPAQEATANQAALSCVEVTPEMVEAGCERLLELKDETGSAYVVEQVYLAMVACKSFQRS